MKKILILPLLMLFFGMILNSCLFLPLLISGEEFDVEAAYYVDFINKSNDIAYVSIRSSAKNDEFTMKDVFEHGPIGSFLVRADVDSMVKVDTVYDGMIEDRWYYQVIVISQHTLDTYSKEEIIERNIYDKKIDMSCTELKALDFKIVYTGDNKTERM